MQFINKLISNLDPKYVYRICLFGVIVILGGVQADRNWHSIYPLREHYFIIPHIIVYVGICISMLSFIALKIKKYNISLFLFILFPIISVFDEFWHDFYGVELISSPMAYWSPAHWSLYIAFFYILYCLNKIKIEDNRFLILLTKGLMFTLIIKGLAFVLVPLSPFTRYIHLVSDFNILSAVFILLSIFTVHKIFQDKEVSFVALLLLYSNTGPTNLFMPKDFIYNNGGIMLIFYFLIFLFLNFDKTKIQDYFAISYLLVIWTFFWGFLIQGNFEINKIVFSFVIVSAFVPIYYYTEEFLLQRYEKYAKTQ